MIQLYVGIPSSYLEQIEAAFVGRTNDAFVEGGDCRIDKLEALGGTFVNRRLDLYDNFDLLITKSIADIKSPESRSSEYTKTVLIPGTAANNKLFGHIFEIEQNIQGSTQFAPDFNPNKKADVVVLLDEVEQLRGFIRLIQINVLDSTQIEYECSLHGKTADLFTNIADLKLNQLDFTEYNHTLSSGNIIDSWATSIYKNGNTQAFSLGEGYVYAMIDKGHPTNIAVWETKQFTPCLYAKTVIDKIFTNSGFSYTNDSYFNSTDFKRLVMPNPSPLSADASVLEGRRFKASRITTSQSLDLNSVLIFQNDSTSGNYDNGNNYNNTTGQYTLPVGGDYAFDLDLLMLYQSTGYVPVVPAEIWLVFGLYVNGVLKDTLTVTPNIGSNTNRQLTLFPFTLLQGSVVDIRLVQVYDDANKYNLTNAQFSLDLLATSNIESNQSAYTFGVGETVNFSMFLNSEVKQSEIFMSFVKMFNLYIEPTQDQPKVLRIVPRDDFYNGSQVDWTNKLDYSQALDIIPMGDLDANPYVFAYKEGKDETNVIYQQNYQTTYGSRTYKIDNDFVKNEKKIDIAFSPTQIKSYNSQKNFVLSQMPNSQDGDLRIMYYSGLVDGVNWRLWNQYAGVGLDYSYRNQLPLTLHYNSITNPTFDILFGMPREIGIGAGYKYANVNLVNKFYYKFLTEITSKNSKLVRAYFRITPNDWLNLSFADAYFFEGQYWRLNKVEDYNPITDGVYLCEFLLAQFVEPATITTKTIGAGTAQGQQGETLGDIYPGGNNPIKPGIKGVNIGLGQGGAGVIQGDNIVQNQNTVDAFSVISSNTTFQAGTDGSGAILCDDFTVTKPDTLYIGNYEMYPNFLSGGAVQTVTANTTATKDDRLFLVDTTSGNKTITLPDPTGLSGKQFVVKKLTSAHTITVDTTGTAKIDGADTHSINQHWASHIFETDGVDYFIIAEK
jgi:hypothetical protein